MVIIALGEKDVAEDLLIDVLWPESDGDAAHEAFKVNLSKNKYKFPPNVPLDGRQWF